MTVLTRSDKASMDANQAVQVAAGNLYAGEDLDPVAPCYIKASDGKVYMSDGAAAAEAAKFVGFTPKSYLAGEPVTLFGYGTRFKYGSGLTPGAIYYIAEVDAYTDAGLLDTAVTTGDTQGTAMAINATDIVVCRVSPNYG